MHISHQQRQVSWVRIEATFATSIQWGPDIARTLGTDDESAGLSVCIDRDSRTCQRRAARSVAILRFALSTHNSRYTPHHKPDPDPDPDPDEIVTIGSLLFTV